MFVFTARRAKAAMVRERRNGVGSQAACPVGCEARTPTRPGSREATIGQAAQKAADQLVMAQNPSRAWRYTSKCGENDASVTGWCVEALWAAQQAGLAVRHRTLREARWWIEEVTDRNYGKVGYQCIEEAGVSVYVGPNQEHVQHDALGAVGMVVRSLVDDDRKDPLPELSSRLLAHDLPVTKAGWIDYSYWYHGTMALFRFDGPGSDRPQERWKPWNEAVTAALVRSQESKDFGCSEGSWLANDRWSDAGGRVYTTALGALTLEIYYRYAPPRPPGK